LSAGRLVQLGSPRDIYERPETEFAATFIGGANVFPGKVVGRDSGGTVVEAGNGLRIVTTDRAALAAGTAVDVIVRPEHPTIALQGVASGVNQWQARVRQTLFLGNRVECLVEVAGVRLRVEIPSGRPEPATGDTVVLSIAPAQALCFAGATSA
jgi:ABC-type Fe3+/spermidine/putrescine transport system ATPase subunit